MTLLDYRKSDSGSDILIESGKRIRYLRKKKKISIEKLVTLIRDAGIGIKAKSVISKWENGIKPIETIGQLAALADLLGCDPEYITCQCDTLRKEYADPVQRFGLSEQSFAVLEHAPERARSAVTASFVLENMEVTLALYSILRLYHDKRMSEPAETLIDFMNDKETEERLRSGEDVAFIRGGEYSLHHRLDLVKDDNRQYTISQNQATFIAEQQLIDEIRKALERTDKTAPGSYPTLYPTLYPKTPTD